MTEKDSNCDCNSINFGDFTREDINKIMINGGYEKDPKENEWIYKPKDANSKKQLFLPKNKGRLEKENVKDDIINNIKNKGLNPYARDFIPKNKEKSNNNTNNNNNNNNNSNNSYINHNTAPVVFQPLYYDYINFQFPQFVPYAQTPEMYYPMRMRNYSYGTYPSQEGIIPGSINGYEMDNSQPNARVPPVSFYPISMSSATIIQNIPGGKLNEPKNMMPVNNIYVNGEQNNHKENKENQDVVIDIESSNEDLTDIPENQDINENIQNEITTESAKEESESQQENLKTNDQKENLNIKADEEQKSQSQPQQSPQHQPQQSQQKKKNNKEKSILSDQLSKNSEFVKNKCNNENKKVKSNDQQKKNKDNKDSTKNNNVSKEENPTNKKKVNDKKKNTIKINKENKSNDTNKEPGTIKETSENKRIEKDVKTEDTSNASIEPEKKEEKKEVKKEEPVKPKSWASLFSSEDTKSNNARIKASKVSKTITTKVNQKNQNNSNEPIDLNDKIKISFEPVPIQPRGLINNGNMCFMNAILQPLLYCPPFYNFIQSLKKETIHSLNDKHPSIIESMIMFIDAFKVVKKKDLDIEDYGESFLPEYVYSTLRKFNSTNSLNGRQEDAEEYLGFLLNGIHDEFILKYSNPKTSKKSDNDGWNVVTGPKNKYATKREAEVKESPINRIFGGKIKSILRRPSSKDSATVEPFLSLQLDITPDDVNDIEDALRNLTIPEQVPDYIVDGKKVNATKQNVIESLPDVLLLHLKCFTFDHNTALKVQKQINFKPVLEIKPDLLSTELLSSRKSRTPYRYNLFAVVNHHGKMAGGGHYTCAVKQCNNRWLNFDDTKIKQTTELEVITPNKNQLPYLLLYISEQKIKNHI